MLFIINAVVSIPASTSILQIALIRPIYGHVAVLRNFQRYGVVIVAAHYLEQSGFCKIGIVVKQLLLAVSYTTAGHYEVVISLGQAQGADGTRLDEACQSDFVGIVVPKLHIVGGGVLRRHDPHLRTARRATYPSRFRESQCGFVRQIFGIGLQSIQSIQSIFICVTNAITLFALCVLTKPAGMVGVIPTALRVMRSPHSKR